MCGCGVRVWDANFSEPTISSAPVAGGVLVFRVVRPVDTNGQKRRRSKRQAVCGVWDACSVVSVACMCVCVLRERRKEGKRRRRFAQREERYEQGRDGRERVKEAMGTGRKRGARRESNEGGVRERGCQSE